MKYITIHSYPYSRFLSIFEDEFQDCLMKEALKECPFNMILSNQFSFRLTKVQKMYLIIVLGCYKVTAREIILSDKIYLNKPESTVLRELSCRELSLRIIKY